MLFTGEAAVKHGMWSSSIVPQCQPIFWKAIYSDTNVALSPARSHPKVAGWRWQIKGLCFSMKSGTCLWNYNRNSCVLSKSESSSPSVAPSCSFLREEGLSQAIRAFALKGSAVFGTCAGAIPLAKRVQNPVQASLGLLDVTIIRNGYGRQMSSDVSLGGRAEGRTSGDGFYSCSDHRIGRALRGGARQL